MCVGRREEGVGGRMWEGACGGRMWEEGCKREGVGGRV